MQRIGMYTDSSGRKRPVTKSLYGSRPRSANYSRQIDFGDRFQAEESVVFADKRWDSYTSREKRVHLLQAMNEAANRAKAMYEARNDNGSYRLSELERRKAMEAHAVLRQWVDSHKRKE